MIHIFESNYLLVNGFNCEYVNVDNAQKDFSVLDCFGKNNKDEKFFAILIDSFSTGTPQKKKTENVLNIVLRFLSEVHSKIKTKKEGEIIHLFIFTCSESVYRIFSEYHNSYQFSEYEIHLTVVGYLNKRPISTIKII